MGSIDSPAHDTLTAPDIAERMTISLVKKAAGDLADLQRSTGLNKTDVTNRAITAYAFIEAQMRAGRDLYVKDPQTGETQLIRFL